MKNGQDNLSQLDILKSHLFFAFMANQCIFPWVLKCQRLSDLGWSGSGWSRRAWNLELDSIGSYKFGFFGNFGFEAGTSWEPQAVVFGSKMGPVHRKHNLLRLPRASLIIYLTILFIVYLTMYQIIWSKPNLRYFYWSNIHFRAWYWHKNGPLVN